VVSDLGAVAENIRRASLALRAYARFHDNVAAAAIDMAERGDPTSLRLLNAMKDLQAQTGELYVEENE
jgi:N-acetylglucosamine kinase-like BadF-type ATPase